MLITRATINDLSEIERLNEKYFKKIMHFPQDIISLESIGCTPPIIINNLLEFLKKLFYTISAEITKN